MPDKILVEDQDGGYIVAEKVDNKDIVNTDEIYIPLYKYKEYYHNLESALKSEF